MKSKANGQTMVGLKDSFPDVIVGEVVYMAPLWWLGMACMSLPVLSTIGKQK